MININTILIVLTIIICTVCINSSIRYKANIDNKKVILSKDIYAMNVKYSEEEILAHLDYIITESIDDYNVMQIAPNEISYINNDIEDKIRKHVTDNVTSKISNTLYMKLALIYDTSCLKDVIAQRIYISVTNFVIEFNSANIDEVTNKKN